MEAFVYIVECADGTLYTGWTTDVARRVQEHNAGRGARYTRGRRPVRLVLIEFHPTQAAAMQREAAIKRLPRAAKWRLIWEGNEISRC
ncbi:MAG: GIY-YIG nuclease family protein [Ardenticatenaceae bacterium]|nr:GIY-YIG nuclease family protein [Ardenticatenaceae bacterium]